MPFKPTDWRVNHGSIFVQVTTSAFGLLKSLEDHLTERQRVSFQHLWDGDCILPAVTQHLAEWNSKCAGTANYTTVNLFWLQALHVHSQSASSDCWLIMYLKFYSHNTKATPGRTLLNMPDECTISSLKEAMYEVTQVFLQKTSDRIIYEHTAMEKKYSLEGITFKPFKDDWCIFPFNSNLSELLNGGQRLFLVRTDHKTLRSLRHLSMLSMKFSLPSMVHFNYV